MIQFVYDIRNEPHSLSQTCLWVFEGLLQRHGSAVPCRGDWDSSSSSSGRHSVWHKPSWGKSPFSSFSSVMSLNRIRLFVTP